MTRRSLVLSVYAGWLLAAAGFQLILTTWFVARDINDRLAPRAPDVLVIQRIYPAPGEPFTVMAAVASWYGKESAGRTTANGELFDPGGLTAAHRDWPMGTWVELRNPANGRTVAVRINDRGPFVPGRDLDLSMEAARLLGMVEAGVVRLEARILRWGGE